MELLESEKFFPKKGGFKMVLLMASLVGLLVGVITCVLFWIFIRTRYDFKDVFGVFPKKATPEDVNKIIIYLQNTLEQDKERGTPTDESVEYLNTKIKRAKKLATKYNFSVPA